MYWCNCYTICCVLLNINCFFSEVGSQAQFNDIISLPNDPLYNLVDLQPQHIKPRWVVIAGRKVVPGSISRVAVQILSKANPWEDVPVHVTVSLLYNHQQITFAQTTVQPGDLSDVLLQVPEGSQDGKWQLKVEGFEGQLNVFKDFTDLVFTPDFLTILIQTSRPIYNIKQRVHFRIVLLTKEFTPYDKPIDVFVLDPMGRIMRRWPSRQPSDGVVSLHFDLPEFPLLGQWTIRAKAKLQTEQQTISVRQYFNPRFEVFVRLPHTVKLSGDHIEGAIIANMTNGRAVYGNCSITLKIAMDNDSPTPTQYLNVYQQFIPNFVGVHAFRLPMSPLMDNEGGVDMLNEKIIQVEATVGDAFGWGKQTGWALSRLHTDTVQLSFLGDPPFFFQTDMPITLHLLVAFTDYHPLSEAELEGSELLVTIWASETISISVSGAELIENLGVATITATIPDHTDQLEISGKFTSANGVVSEAKTQGIQYYSPRKRHLMVETSTEEASTGEFIVLHVRNDFYVSKINYVVLADGVLVYNGQEPVLDLSYPTVTTFSLPASAAMSPVAKIMVWVVDQDGEIVVHALSVPVNPLTRHEVEVHWNYHKDHSGNTVEVHVSGETGAYFATTSSWEEVHRMDSGHNLDESRVLYHMMGLTRQQYQNANDTIPHVRHAPMRLRDGSASTVRFFATPNIGADVPSTFLFSNAVLMTDAFARLHPALSADLTACANDTELSCLTGGCFVLEQKCDGIPNCVDSSDEFGCPINVDPYRNFRLNRISSLRSLYNIENGDWAWSEIRGEGGQVLVFEIPKRPESWVFTLFAVGKQTGLGIYRQNINIDCMRPFHLSVEGPHVARMWEQAGLAVGVFNFHSATIGVLLTMPSSPDYQVIIVEGNGVVESYNPRKLEGTFQHVVWLEPGTSKDIHIPIVFNRQGEIEITVEGSTQMNRHTETITIEVVPEGVSIGQHTSVLLDLKNRAVVYEFMDVHLDESPIIPYSLQRRFIFSTPSGQISLSGDVVGPLFPEVPVNTDNMIGLDVIGAETSSYNFAANIWSLHYLRLTNQLQDRLRYEVLTAVNLDYASLARYQGEQGGFSNWVDAEESVWLTSHALKSLTTVSFQDWENYIYIDPSIVNSGVRWLLQYQTGLGSFMETSSFWNPLDPKVDPRSRSLLGEAYKNISLTAKVLITLTDVLPILQGDLHYETILSKQKAMRYLEMLLPEITDPYELAVVTWALTKAESPEKEFAFSLLDAIKRVKGDMIYWSREDIIIDPVVFEDNQRSFLQPKEDNRWDSLTSEATSYALLVYVKREGIGIVQENIVRFMSSMRSADGGILSTLDSLVALEALVEYSYRARLREVTDMTVIIEQSASPEATIEININNQPGLAEIQTYELGNIWGHIIITGRGSGQAILQLDYSYGVDSLAELDQPVWAAFELEVSAKYYGRNSSHITITSCQRWINTEETNTSGLAVVEIHLPSGYHVVLNELLAIVYSGEVPHLRWARITGTDVKFFFNKLTEDRVCLSYNIARWFPVANHSRYNLAQVYEMYQPERFEMQRFELFPLYALDICEVCGSFQCPYCPFYSGCNRQAPPFSFMICLLFVMMCHYKILY